MRYAPPGYKGIASLTSSSVSLVLPPPHIKIPASINTEGEGSRRASSSSCGSDLSSGIGATEDEAISIETSEDTRDDSAEVIATYAVQPVPNDGNVEPNLVPLDKVPPWEETPSHYGEASYTAIGDPELDIYSGNWDHVLPSLYFEVELGFRRMSDLDLNDDTKW